MMTREELLNLDISGTELHDFINNRPEEVDKLLPEMEWATRFRMHALTGTPATIIKILEDWKGFHRIAKIACWNRVMGGADLRLAKALHKLVADDIIAIFMYSPAPCDIT